MQWMNIPVGKTEKKNGIIDQETETEIMAIEIHIGIPIGIKADHSVGTGIHGLPVDHLGIEIIGRIEIGTGIGSEIEIIEGIEVHPMKGMRTQDPEVVQESGTILI